MKRQFWVLFDESSGDVIKIVFCEKNPSNYLAMFGGQGWSNQWTVLPMRDLKFTAQRKFINDPYESHGQGD